VWFTLSELQFFYSVHRGNFLWCSETRDTGADGAFLLELVRSNSTLDSSRLFYQNSFDAMWREKGVAVEQAVNNKLLQLEGKIVSTTQEVREVEQRRRDCAGCPGAMICWGGEEVLGYTCVVCGRQFIGIRGDDKDDLNVLGAVATTCSTVTWRKHVCQDCSPGYRETVNEALYTLLQQYENDESQ